MTDWLAVLMVVMVFAIFAFGAMRVGDENYGIGGRIKQYDINTLNKNAKITKVHTYPVSTKKKTVFVIEVSFDDDCIYTETVTPSNIDYGFISRTSTLSEAAQKEVVDRALKQHRSLCVEKKKI